MGQGVYATCDDMKHVVAQAFPVCLLPCSLLFWSAETNNWGGI